MKMQLIPCIMSLHVSLYVIKERTVSLLGARCVVTITQQAGGSGTLELNTDPGKTGPFFTFIYCWITAVKIIRRVQCCYICVIIVIIQLLCCHYEFVILLLRICFTVVVIIIVILLLYMCHIVILQL